MKLFKYMPPARLDVLRSRLICFSPPSSLNDPFELKPHLREIGSETQIVDDFQRKWPDLLAAKYGALPAQIRRNFSLENFQKLGLNQLPQATADLRSKRKTERPAVQQKIAEAFEQVGILCLSASPDNLLMWAHYAQAHEGLVVEFDATHPFFDQRTRPGEVLKHLREVEYDDKRPSLSLSEMGNFTHIFVKSQHWVYEQEWRILFLLSEASRIVKNNGKLAHLFEFPPTIVTGVIFGCRMTSSDRTKCLKTLDEISGYEHVRCFQSSVDEGRFSLNYSEVDR